ncbi:MAG: LysM peptidoglycan-binding domain-containing protein [Sulfuriferula sp.]|nr:LysM peptidoglycan-binding domain-containing protein [Sulfuriferula sp.]
MKTQSRLLASMIFTALALQGCANAGAVKPDAVAAPAPVAAPVAAEVKPVEPVVAVSTAVEKPAVEVAKLPDSYTVVAGDTLAKVAARKDVYGNAKLWPLLYRGNSGVIGIQGLIYPGQVLTIDRSYTTTEADAIINKTKTHKPATGLVAIPLPSTTTTAVSVTTVAKTEVAAPAAMATPAPDYVNAARRAFAAGDIPWAVYYYNLHLSKQLKDIRAWGELGNVYYFDGQLAESAQAYFNAANLMIDQGRARSAGQLLPAINEGNPMLAQALYGRLATLK